MRYLEVYYHNQEDFNNLTTDKRKNVDTQLWHEVGDLAIAFNFLAIDEAYSKCKKEKRRLNQLLDAIEGQIDDLIEELDNNYLVAA